MNELSVEEMTSICGGILILQSFNKQVSVGNLNAANSGNLAAGVILVGQQSGSANAGNQTIGGN
jgi:hypothetical protein